MPFFKNKSNRHVTILFNGRKIRVKPNGIIEGPDQFSSYKDLELFNKEKVEVNKKMTNYNQKPVVLDPKVRSPKPVNIGMVSIPDLPITVTQDYDRNEEINKTIKHIKNWNRKKKPSVGICILSKDSLKLISDCCLSILEKVHYENTKIYIFDTGTRDREVISFYEKMKDNKKFPFHVINVGNFQFSKNYNFGAQKINTDYIVIQNNDTVALNDYISRLTKIAHVEKVGCCGPRMLYKDMRIQHDGQFLFSPDGKFINPGHVNLGKQPSQVSSGIYKVDGITGAGIFMRTDLFRELKFDEGYKDIYQDVQLNIDLGMLNYIRVCDRDAVIHHYDNTSRKGLWRKPEEISKMREDHNYLFTKIKSRKLHYKKRGRHAFSIITLVNNEKQYFDLLECLRIQDFKGPFEIIALPNFNGEYKSCAEALNIGLDLSESKYSILCHQDLLLDKNWLSSIFKRITDLDSQKINWGVLGMAGAITHSNIDYGCNYLANEFNKDESCFDFFYKTFKKDFVQVQCIDELCLVVKSDNKIRFDEQVCDHYHWYGADFCLQYIKEKYNNFVINSPCIHLSDGFSNLKKKEHMDSYIEGAKSIQKKWRNDFSSFRTMTAKFINNNDLIHFFVADTLIKEGINFPKQIKSL